MNKELVVDINGNIHLRGCKNASANSNRIAEGFQGTSLKDFATWWAKDYNENTNEQTTDSEWLPFLKQDLHPCTGIR